MFFVIVLDSRLRGNDNPNLILWIESSLFVGNQAAMGKLFEELKASGSVRSGERSCQSLCPPKMSSRRKDIRTHPLRARSEAASFSQALLPYTWDSKGRSLRTVQNLVSAYESL